MAKRKVWRYQSSHRNP